MAFGENLKRLRKNFQLSQQDLSEQVGIASSTISLYEHGQRQPDFERLKKLKDYFNCSYDDLLKREEKADGDKVDLRELLTKEEVYFGGKKINEAAVKALLLFLRNYRKEGL